MKKYFSFLLLIITVSCTPLLNVNTTPNAKQLWQQHKRVAIIPLRITQTGAPFFRKAGPESDLKELSFSFQNSMYMALQHQYNLSNLSVTIMPIDSTTQLMAKFGMVYENMPSENINKLCALLNVDAVIGGSVEFAYKTSLEVSALPMAPTPGLEKAYIELDIYDKNSRTPIWRFNESAKATHYDDYYKRNGNNLGNKEYIVAYAFDKAMKILPYVIKSPIKRF